MIGGACSIFAGKDAMNGGICSIFAAADAMNGGICSIFAATDATNCVVFSIFAAADATGGCVCYIFAAKDAMIVVVCPIFTAENVLNRDFADRHEKTRLTASRRRARPSTPHHVTARRERAVAFGSGLNGLAARVAENRCRPSKSITDI